MPSLFFLLLYNIPPFWSGPRVGHSRSGLYDSFLSRWFLFLIILAPSDPFIREIADEHIDSCFRAIVEVAADEFIPHSPDGPSHIVQGGCARFVFRKLLQTDPKRKDGHKLSDFLADLPPESLASWIGMNCGLYALVEMYKSGSTKARKVLKEAISLKSLKAIDFLVEMLF